VASYRALRPTNPLDAQGREVDMMVDGALVLPIAFGALAAIWILVLLGSRLFGPKEG
jgi:hypothetical protein